MHGKPHGWVARRMTVVHCVWRFGAVCKGISAQAPVCSCHHSKI
jgi:hypothetical protein